ncbi:MAG: hypothetical protein R2839_00285 [Thermomicrobiales bacterium]
MVPSRGRSGGEARAASCVALSAEARRRLGPAAARSERRQEGQDIEQGDHLLLGMRLVDDPIDMASGKRRWQSGSCAA